MAIKKSYLGMAALLAVIVVALVLFSTYGGMQQSIVSMDSINFDNTSKKWVANLTLNTAGESLTFQKSSAGTALPDGTTAKTTSDIRIAFIPKTPTCNYNLTWKTHPLTLLFFWQYTSIPYAQLTGMPVRSMPYDVKVYKNNVLVTPATPPKFDASILGESSVKLLDGQIEIRNLGQLSNGYDQCPDPSGAVLTPTYSNNNFSNYKLVSADSWFAYRKEITRISNFPLGLNDLMNFLANPGLEAPVAFSGMTTNVSTVSQGSTKLVADLQKGSGFANITVIVDEEFADTVYYSPPKGEPSVSLSLSKSTWDQDTASILQVNIKNIGTGEDSFSTIPSTSAGVVNFTPQAQYSPLIAVGATSTVQYSVYGLGSGTTDICVVVQALGSGKSANKCITATVAESNLPPEPPPQQLETCGNGVCGTGENYSYCPQDCEAPAGQTVCGNGKCEALEQLTCPADCTTAPVGELCGNNRIDPQENCGNCPADVKCAQGLECRNSQCLIPTAEDDFLAYILIGIAAFAGGWLGTLSLKRFVKRRAKAEMVMAAFSIGAAIFGGIAYYFLIMNPAALPQLPDLSLSTIICGAPQQCGFLDFGCYLGDAANAGCGIGVFLVVVLASAAMLGIMGLGIFKNIGAAYAGAAIGALIGIALYSFLNTYLIPIVAVLLVAGSAYFFLAKRGKL